jgi:hypothetical protein
MSFALYSLQWQFILTAGCARKRLGIYALAYPVFFSLALYVSSCLLWGGVGWGNNVLALAHLLDATSREVLCRFRTCYIYYRFPWCYVIRISLELMLRHKNFSCSYAATSSYITYIYICITWCYVRRTSLHCHHNIMLRCICIYICLTGCYCIIFAFALLL